MKTAREIIAEELNKSFPQYTDEGRVDRLLATLSDAGYAVVPLPSDERDSILRELTRVTADADAHGDPAVSISFELSDKIVVALATRPPHEQEKP